MDPPNSAGSDCSRAGAAVASATETSSWKDCPEYKSYTHKKGAQLIGSLVAQSSWLVLHSTETSASLYWSDVGLLLLLVIKILEEPIKCEPPIMLRSFACWFSWSWRFYWQASEFQCAEWGSKAVKGRVWVRERVSRDANWNKLQLRAPSGRRHYSGSGGFKSISLNFYLPNAWWRRNNKDSSTPVEAAQSTRLMMIVSAS